MNDYKEHFLLDKESVVDYTINNLGLFGKNSSVSSKEIGDGNINYVFQLYDAHSGKSVVLKQADKLLRSSGRPLDIKRSKIESEILKIQHSLSPRHIPEVYHYDENMSVLAMEDISDFKNLRKEFQLAHRYDLFAEEISDFLVATLLPSTDLFLAADVKKKRIQLFTNIDLCAISETLIFLEPYDDYKQQNNYSPINKEFVEKKLYHNNLLKSEVAELRYNFMNNAQALLHGDLHSGSIFINSSGIKVIDPEFAFYGPMGYDIGNVIGNLIFTFAYHYYVTKNMEFLSWLEEQIRQIFDSVHTKLYNMYSENIANELYKTDCFKQTFINSILHDTVGYAGTEIIRRSIGDSRVSEVESIQDDILRATVERVLINIGESYIINRKKVISGEDLIEMIKPHLN